MFEIKLILCGLSRMLQFSQFVWTLVIRYETSLTIFSLQIEVRLVAIKSAFSAKLIIHVLEHNFKLYNRVSNIELCLHLIVSFRRFCKYFLSRSKMIPKR